MLSVYGNGMLLLFYTVFDIRLFGVNLQIDTINVKNNNYIENK